MKQTVMIKGNAYGLVVMLDKEAPFQDILKEVAVKFRDSAKFFKNAKMAVSFEGRKLSPEEQQQLIETITDNSTITVVCVLDKDEENERRFKKKLEEAVTGSATGSGQFYKGTLRSGQVFESESSVIILGDVNPGARVVAKGNVVVLGALRGTAFAGLSGNEQAFVVALEMAPTQIRIADTIARSADRPPAKADSADQPKIAYIENGNIYIEPLCKEVINDIHLI